MACLNEARIQAVADGEATAAEVEHVQWCSQCRARVTETEDDLRAFAKEMSAIEVPRVRAIAGAPAPRAGATTLRPVSVSARRQPAWIFAGAAAAAVILALFVVFPSFDEGTRLNASEILDRSLATLSRSGVELMKYQLSINAPRMAPESGDFLIEQLIDHQGGRWRFSRFGSDGSLLSGIAEDPAAGRRDVFVREGGRSYRMTFQLADADRMPLWDLQRRYAEALIRIVQASGARADLQTDANGLQQYVIELPGGAVSGTAPIFDLHRARVVIDSTDFHVVEFSAGGSAVGDAVSIDYRLIERNVWDTQPDVNFELPQDPNAVVLTGQATPNIPHDIFKLVLSAVKP
jgi:hypothetical protein